jgi:DNA mismatch repair protein MutS
MTTKINLDTLTPMMKQWHRCKVQAKDAILLFRMGDFYEAFYEDAELASKLLDLTLTKRANTPMAGVPYQNIDPYIDRLVAKGYKVAIAEQMEDPKYAKGIVERKIVRTISPGTIVASSLVQDKNYNYILCVHEENGQYGISFIDCTTTTLNILIVERTELLNELYKVRPAEILCTKKFFKSHPDIFNELRLGYPVAVTTCDQDIPFTQDRAESFLKRHFKVHTLDGFGLQNEPCSIISAFVVLAFIKETLNTNISHIKEIKHLELEHVMNLDKATQANLELLEPLNNNHKSTLFDLIDHTHTPMGTRLLKEWLKRPLLNLEMIQERQESVEEITKNSLCLKRLQKDLPQIKDLERLMMKISTHFATPKDFLALKYSLFQVPKVKEATDECTSELIKKCNTSLEDTSTLATYLDKAISDEAPFRVSEGGVIKKGFNQELDALRTMHLSSTHWLLDYQEKLRKELNIKTLKVGFNRIFGYYIEVSKAQSKNMPQSFAKKQTLVNQDRFISQELKTFEEKVLSAEEQTLALEQKLFQEIREYVAESFDLVVHISKSIGILDVLCSFAYLAIKMDYTRPRLNDSTHLEIEQGRHPVIEASLIDEPFISNDCFFNEQCRMMILTGPNMGGKSTYLRQIAHICILAQMGSFVPAKFASIGIIDKIFTRIGASDDLARNQSTFMVEMAQTANILNNATPNSLIILDEIGRGTSTFDGIAIAQAVIEYLYTQKQAPKTLFATHFFELTKLEKALPKVKNFHVAVQEDEKITFLHKTRPGALEKSYGIFVAKLAGLPPFVINEAKKILQGLEQKAKTCHHTPQSLFETPKNPIEKKWIAQLKKIDLNTTTPMQALHFLEELKKWV